MEKGLMKYGLFFLFFLFYTPVCHGDTLTFAFSDFPPFEYSENGNLSGINKEIIDAACKRLQITPVFVELPWKRALKNAKTGRVDAVFSLFKNDERIKDYNFPDQRLNSVKMVLINTRGKDIEISDWADLKGKRIGVFLGSSYGEAFDRDTKIIKITAPTNASLLKMQAAGRTDLTIMDAQVLKFWSRKIGMENKFKVLDFIVTENPTYIAFSKVRGTKNWAVIFSDVLKDMRADGVMDKIHQKYLSE